LSQAELAVALFILLAALLYSSVGHGGASGYLAVMALAGLAPAVMKPSALALNILVSAIAAVRFARLGHFSWALFWPFALGSIPAAFLGGAVTLPVRGYQIVLGVILVFAAFRTFVTSLSITDESGRPPAFGLALAVGLLIGFASGLIGVGGGIFLSPLILLLGWAGARTTAGVSAVFILVNSVAGLAGYFTAAATLPAALPLWAAAAVIGGWLGAGYGSRRLPPPALRKMLALVLVVAGVKLILLL
jgi:uncharacterized membrane protein YfcA